MHDELINVFHFMLLDLRRSYLEVVLVRAPEPRYHGHLIRVVNSENPSWYQRICARYPSRARSHRYNPWKHTRVKRKEVLRVLQRLILKRTTRSFLVDELVEEARDIFQEWKEEMREDA